MRFAIGTVVFATLVGAANFWASGTAIEEAPAGTMVGAGLSIILVAWLVRVWVRNRRQKRVLGMRGSALW